MVVESHGNSYVGVGGRGATWPTEAGTGRLRHESDGVALSQLYSEGLPGETHPVEEQLSTRS
jgi:hypothetical protein